MRQLRQVAGWFFTVYGGHPAVVAILAGSWLVAGFLARVGIPAVDPSLEFVPRPLETLGTAAICLPAALHVSLLKDDAAWLSAVSPPSPWRLRLCWILAVQAGAGVAALVWAVTLPADVPPAHACALWVLVSGAAVLSVVLVGSAFGAVIPVALMGVSSTPGIVPFDVNLVYNVDLTGSLLVLAGLVWIVATGWFVCCGDRRSFAQG